MSRRLLLSVSCFYRSPVSFLVQNSPCASRNSGQSLWEAATFAPCSTEVWRAKNTRHARRVSCLAARSLSRICENRSHTLGPYPQRQARCGFHFGQATVSQNINDMLKTKRYPQERLPPTFTLLLRGLNQRRRETDIPNDHWYIYIYNCSNFC